jgi:hypothetical protein
MLITSLYTNLRAVLGDQGSNGVYQWKDEVLSGALLSVVQLGMGPAGVAVSVDGLSLDPAPASPDARGYLVIQAALSLIGGNTPVSFKSRGLNVMIRPEERITTIEHYRRLLAKLEKDGDPHGTGGVSLFGIWQDFENAVCPIGGVKQVV